MIAKVGLLKKGKMMFDEKCVSGVHSVDCKTRVEGLRSAFWLATEALDRGLYDSVTVVSPRRQLAFGYRLEETPCTISLVSASDARLNEWSFAWPTTKEALGKLHAATPTAGVGITYADTIGRSSWYSDDFLQAMYDRGPSDLQIWDLSTDEGRFLPCVNGEAKRRGICVLAVKAGENAASDGEVLPNFREIPVYERCLALIRTAEKVSHSMIQRAFCLSWSEADRLMMRLEKEGVIKESKEGPLPYEVDWRNVPKGPGLLGAA